MAAAAFGITLLLKGLGSARSPARLQYAQASAATGVQARIEAAHPLPRRLSVTVALLEDFAAFTAALRTLGRLPGVASPRAVELRQHEGVFEMTLTEVTTPAAMAQMLGAAFPQGVTVERLA